MFGKKSEGKPLGRIDSLIGAGTRIEGSLFFTGGLRIDGEVKGSVQAVEGASATGQSSGKQRGTYGRGLCQRQLTGGVQPRIITDEFFLEFCT